MFIILRIVASSLLPNWNQEWQLWDSFLKEMREGKKEIGMAKSSRGNRIDQTNRMEYFLFFAYQQTATERRRT